MADLAKIVAIVRMAEHLTCGWDLIWENFEDEYATVFFASLDWEIEVARVGPRFREGSVPLAVGKRAGFNRAVPPVKMSALTFFYQKAPSRPEGFSSDC